MQNTLLKFPSDINNSMNPAGFVKFVAMEWSVKNKRDMKVKNTSNIIDTIVLPLPSNGMDNNISINWEEDSGLAATGVLDSIKHAGFGAVKDLLGGIGKKVAFQKGRALNDLAASTFQNVDFRTHDFEWSAVPANANEAKDFSDIVKSFKKNSLPTNQSDNILKFPVFWKIGVYAPTYKEIFSYKMAVCTSVNDNEMPDSIEAFHGDGEAVRRTLSVSFKELFRIESEDIE